MPAFRYVSGLVLCQGLSLLGLLVNLTPIPFNEYGAPNVIGALILLWIVPVIYLLVWQALLRPSFISGLIGGGRIIILWITLSPFAIMSIIGIFPFLALATAGMLAAIATLLGAPAAQFGSDAMQTGWTRWHAICLAIAQAGLALATMRIAYTVPASWGEIAIAVGTLLLPFAAHAIVTWIRTPPAQRPIVATWRILALAGLAWLLPALPLAHAAGLGSALGWPTKALAIIQDRQARLNLPR